MIRWLFNLDSQPEATRGNISYFLIKRLGWLVLSLFILIILYVSTINFIITILVMVKSLLPFTVPLLCQESSSLPTLHLAATDASPLTLYQLVLLHCELHHALLLISIGWSMILFVVFLGSAQTRYETWVLSKLHNWPWLTNALNMAVKFRISVLQRIWYLVLPQMLLLDYVTYFLYANPVGVFVQ